MERFNGLRVDLLAQGVPDGHAQHLADLVRRYEKAADIVDRSIEQSRAVGGSFGTVEKTAAQREQALREVLAELKLRGWAVTALPGHVSYLVAVAKVLGEILNLLILFKSKGT